MKCLCIIAIVALVACGNNTPTAPTPPPITQVAGIWSGTFESSNFNQLAITLQLTQAGTAVNGTWAIQSMTWNGTITGTLDRSAFSGSFTFNGPAAVSGTCTGNASVSGTATASTIDWASPGMTGNCTGLPLAIRMLLQKRS